MNDTNLNFKDFEAALKRLEEIVSRLEEGDLPLEEGIELFEEGVKLSRFCGERLKEAERRVDLLTRNARGELSEEPFEAGEGAGDGV